MWCLNLKSSLVDILAAMHTHKQSTVTFKVFVLWLHNQHYNNCGVIGIKIAIYPTMKVYGPKHTLNINFMKISTMQTFIYF